MPDTAEFPAKEMKKMLDDFGLEAPSSHVPMQLLENELEQQIEYSLEIGAKYIVCPFLDADSKLRGEDNFRNTMASFRQIAAACKENGLQFGYHNHAFEFEKIGDEHILDRMYREIDADLMMAELDLYWVKKAGLDPKQYLMQYKGRTPIIHVKDMTGDGREFFAEVGEGIIDYPAIFDIAPENGVRYYIVEQDQCERPPLESVKMSIDYLKSIGVA